MNSREKLIVKGLNGRKTLEGEVTINGAKNAALPLMAAAMLADDPFEIKDLPNIRDVIAMKELLSGLGAEVSQKGKVTSITPAKKSKGELVEDVAKRLRASIILTGPILSRYGKVVFPHPGGCVLGSRPIDLFLDAYEKMGATVEHSGEAYIISAPRGGLKGADIFFKTMSVTATEALMFAAVFAKGKTVLHNAAMEPEIPFLAECLNAAGAKIEGAGTPTITITPVKKIKQKKACPVLPDRIEAGSFLILGSLLAKNLTIKNVVPEHLQIVTELLKESGVPIEVGKNSISIVNNTKPNTSFKAISFRTHEYPGFPTDLQAPMVVFLTQVKGESTVLETVFDNRFNFVQDLIRMGARVSVWNPHQVTVYGPSKLKARNLTGPDIRAGLAYIIAALLASGVGEIDNVHLIDRGYADIEGRLSALGANITRVNS
ncbi:MAG: UDP-N-acetylglucosamine 1-carboxyvinyltransferase [Patescibacteria group bacterium UBA2103]